jgi:hypothetical protein
MNVPTNQYDTYMKEASTRGDEQASKRLDAIKKKWADFTAKVQEKVQLTPEDHRVLLESEQAELRKHIRNEIFETRRSIILVNDAIKLNQDTLTALETRLPFIEDAWHQVNVQGRINMTKTILQKLQLQAQYLESLQKRLWDGWTKLEGQMVTEKFTPIASEIDDLLAKVDEAQAETDRLAGKVSEKEAEDQALKETDEKSPEKG